MVNLLSAAPDDVCIMKTVTIIMAHALLNTKDDGEVLCVKLQ